MSPDELRTLGLRVYQEVFEQGKLEVADEVIAADFIDSSPGIPPGMSREGPESLKQFATVTRAAIPDLRIRIHEMITDDDTGVARVTFEGTHGGELFGIPASGKHVAWDAVDIVHVREGQIREHYGIADTISLLRQLGAIPSEEGAGA